MGQTTPHIFGVRHLSPAAAWHLRELLERVEPELVLIEGVEDADGLIPHILGAGTRLPIAILAYTAEAPVRTFAYPLARSSPEYQALAWCGRNGAEARFIDLPSPVFLGMMDRDDGAAVVEPGPGRWEEGEEPAGGAEAEPVAAGSIYDRLAELAGEPDFETYWERAFEQLRGPGSYAAAARQYGEELRAMEDFSTPRGVENLAREAHMRMKIQGAIAEGRDPAKMVVVTGAFHATALGPELPAMTGAELARLRRRESKLTLMPYSFFKLSTQSGYGAGNQAPAYFEMLWEQLEAGGAGDLPTVFLSRVARGMREGGTFRSTAEVIEGVRLAEVMAGLRGSAPTLRELRDAAVTLLGQGEAGVVREALARVEVGTAIGALAKGVSQTSIQDDFNRALAELKLEPFKSSVRRELELDLRENRRVKSEAAAFLDLRRSNFLHRLRALEVGFCEPLPVRQDGASWAERWALQWTPEVEIAIVEAVLLGETIELALAFKLKRRLEGCASIAEAAAAIRVACQCGMAGSIELARRTLQRLAGDSSEFTALAGAARELALVLRDGGVRRLDTAPLGPLLEQLFLGGALSMVGAARCDLAAAKTMAGAMAELNRVALDHAGLVDEPLWIAELEKLAGADDLNPLLSGCARALLLERGLVSGEALAREVSRRLSPGAPADLGAGWFEGLARQNRHALLSRLALWEQLDGYLASLDAEEFKRALVFLRRAFGAFSPADKRVVAENLGEVWGLNQENVGEAVEAELTEAEKKQLDELSEFDFGEL